MSEKWREGGREGGREGERERQALVKVMRSRFVEEDEVRFKHLCGLSS